MSVDFDTLLTLMVQKQASDLFITAATPPSIKVNGRVTPVAKVALSGEQSKELVTGLMSPAQREDFAQT
ncbi:MAG: hypothetical protein V3U62_09455 [Sedimenticolaceae bacterium]